MRCGFDFPAPRSTKAVVTCPANVLDLIDVGGLSQR